MEWKITDNKKITKRLLIVFIAFICFLAIAFLAMYVMYLNDKNSKQVNNKLEKDFTIGVKLYDQEDYQNARKIFNKINTLDTSFQSKGHSNANHYLGLVYYSMNEEEQAIKYLNTSINKFNNSTSYYYLAEIKNKKNNDSFESINILETGLRNAKFYDSISKGMYTYKIFDLYLKMKNIEKCIEYLDLALKSLKNGENEIIPGKGTGKDMAIFILQSFSNIDNDKNLKFLKNNKSFISTMYKYKKEFEFEYE